MVERIVNTEFRVRPYWSEAKPWNHWWPQLGRKLLAETAQFSIDWIALEDYCEFIKISEIPSITLFSRSTDDLGYAKYPHMQPAYVALNEHIVPQAASVTLAHEVYHCKQHEENGYKMEEYIDITPNILGWDRYWNHPTEVGARQYEAYGLHTMLVKEL